MAFNENLNNRIRAALQRLEHVEEKYMFGGVCYMVNGKMCVGVIKDDMMCRIDPEMYQDLLEKPGCLPMQFTGRPMKSYVLITEVGMHTKAEFDYWIKLSLDFNQFAKASKKKPKSKKAHIAPE